MKPLMLLVLITLVLAHPSQAEPDKVARILLGVSSLPVRFTPAKEDQVYQLAVAKFKNGKFIGYCEIPAALSYCHRPIQASVYEAEFAWAKREGQSGFLLVTPSWTQNFAPDPFFDNALGLTHYSAYDEPPQGKLGPFQVLGLAVGGASDGPPPKNGQNVTEWIKKYPYTVVFLLAPFSNEEQATAFAKSMPKLTAD